jgi:branched-chain amino acid transport system ATP-binding protein
MACLLRIDSLSAGYGKATVVREVSLQLDVGEIVAMVGHNGAGKSTILKAIIGLIPVRGGAIWFEGQDVTSNGPARKVRAGICLVPQTGNTFPDMSIAENLEMSMRVTQPDSSRRASTLSRVYDLFPALKDRTRQKAKSLSGGQRQMLAIGLALAKEPRLLLLDEPSLGLAPVMVSRVFDSIVEINRAFGTTVLVVEQNVHEAFRIAKRAYIIHSGTVLASDSSEALLNRDDLFELL